MSLNGKNILITGAAVRLGRTMALAMADEGANIIIHYGSSHNEAIATQADIQAKGVKAHLLQADLSDPAQCATVIERAGVFGPLFALVNNAAIFHDLSFLDTDLEAWDRHMKINLGAPFLLSRDFCKSLNSGDHARVVNILDWRALRPGADHFPYTVSKAGLAGLTQAMAVALSPSVTVNGIAFGAVLPPADGGDTSDILKNVPSGRWAKINEVGETLKFLLDGPPYITGEIIHLDGGRHLV